jgi:hypothetical protein
MRVSSAFVTVSLGMILFLKSTSDDGDKMPLHEKLVRLGP